MIPSIDVFVTVSLFIKGAVKEFFSAFFKSILLDSNILILFLLIFKINCFKALFFASELRRAVFLDAIYDLIPNSIISVLIFISKILPNHLYVLFHLDLHIQEFL